MIKNNIESAQDYFNKAYEFQTKGFVDEAIDFYRISIDLFPTAEAHTCLAWVLSLKGKYQLAIEECYAAIEIDPKYGNPYNDIGTYLIHLDRYAEAIYWLEKALIAPKYNYRHLPHYNLGTIYEKKGAWFDALLHYKESFKINHNYEPAQKAVIRLTTLLN